MSTESQWERVLLCFTVPTFG